MKKIHRIEIIEEDYSKGDGILESFLNEAFKEEADDQFILTKNKHISDTHKEIFESFIKDINEQLSKYNLPLFNIDASPSDYHNYTYNYKGCDFIKQRKKFRIKMLPPIIKGTSRVSAMGTNYKFYIETSQINQFVFTSTVKVDNVDDVLMYMKKYIIKEMKQKSE